MSASTSPQTRTLVKRLTSPDILTLAGIVGWIVWIIVFHRGDDEADASYFVAGMTFCSLVVASGAVMAVRAQKWGRAILGALFTIALAYLSFVWWLASSINALM